MFKGEDSARSWAALSDADAADSFRALTKAFPGMVWTATPEGHVDYLDGAWMGFVVRDAPDVRGQALRAEVHPDDLERSYALWNAHLRSGEPFENTLRLRSRTDNSWRWALSRAQPVRDASGAIVRWFGTTIDIDERQRSSDRIAQILEAAPEVVWMTDPAGVLTYANPAWQELTGFDPMVTTDAWELVVHPADLPLLGEAFASSLASGAPFVAEARLRAQDGRYVWTISRARALRDEHGAVSGWYGTIANIDAQKRSEERMRFLADAGHALASSLDPALAVDRLLRLVVTRWASAASLYLTREDGYAYPVAADHRDPALTAALRQIASTLPVRARFAAGGSEDAETIFLPQTDDAMIDALEQSREHGAFLRSRRVRSVIGVPMRARDRTIGSLHLMREESEGAFDEEDLQLAKLLASRAALVLDNTRLYQQEHTVAAAYQRAALPQRLTSVPGLALDAYYEAATNGLAVGGDWYDAFSLGDGRLAVSIGDVMGHDIDAAVVMSGMRQAIRSAALQGLDPARVLASADATLRSEREDVIVTAFVGVIDPIARSLVYASAGHPPGLVRSSDGALTSLDDVSPPLGIAGPVPAQQRVPLPRAGALVLYTDGMLDVSHDLEAAERRLRDAVSAIDPATPDAARALRERVVRDGPTRDDVAVLIVRLQTPAG